MSNGILNTLNVNKKINNYLHCVSGVDRWGCQGMGWGVVYIAVFATTRAEQIILLVFYIKKSSDNSMIT